MVSTPANRSPCSATRASTSAASKRNSSPARLDLVPGHRGRHGRLGALRSDRGDRGLVEGVLAPVDEDRPDARLAIVTVTSSGSVLQHRPGGAGEVGSLLVRGRAVVERHVYLQTLRTRCLRPTLELHAGEQLAHPQRDGAAGGDRGPRPGIEVEDDGPRMVEVGGSSHRGVQLDGCEVRRPHQGRPLGEQAVVDPATSIAWAARHLDPLGPMLRAALLEEPLGSDAVGEALQRDAPPGEVRQHRVGDARVVVDHLALGEARRVQRLVEVGDGEATTVDVDREARGRAHRQRPPVAPPVDTPGAEPLPVVVMARHRSAER